MANDERLKRAGEVFLVPFEQIVIDENINNGRIDLGNLEELANSIEESGLRMPLLVKKERGQDKYVLMQGKRRLKAIEILINRGVEFAGIKCFLALPNYSLENSLFDQIVMNDGKPYSNLEQGLVFNQLIDRGYSLTDIAKKIGKSITHVVNCSEIASLPKKVQDMVASGSVSGLTAVDLAKVVSSEDELISKLEDAVESAPVAADGTKKKVTKKNVSEVANLSPMKKLEEVKKLISETDGVNLKLAEFFVKLVSRLKAGENVDSLIELFK